MSLTMTISSYSASNTAPLITFSMSSLYPFVRNLKLASTRSGVLLSPSRSTFSPNSSKICSTRSEMRSATFVFCLMLEQLLLPAFQLCFDTRHELIRQGAVDQPVIEGEREVCHGADGNSIVNDHRTFGNGPNAQNGNLWLIDDRRTQKAAEDTGVGNSKGSVLNILRG